MPTTPHARTLLALAALMLAACPPAIEAGDSGPGADVGVIDDAAGAAQDGAPSADAAPEDTTWLDVTAGDRTAGDSASADSAMAIDAGAADGVGSVDAGSDGGAAALWCTAPSPTLVGLSAQELHALLPVKDFVLINVADSTGAQIPGTDTFIDYRDVDGLAAYLGTDLEAKVVLYCQSGNRSSQAGNALVGRGYCAVRHLLGGRTAWAAAGYPFE